MLENSTENNDSIQRRCILIKDNDELEEIMVCLSDKEAVKKIIGDDAEFKGEMEGQSIAILGAKNTEGLKENNIGFELTPKCDSLYGNLLAFLVGVNGKPIDLSLSHYRRSKKTLRKRQNASNKKETKKEEKEEVVPEKNEKVNEVYVEGLPYETTEDEVREFFSDCGEINEIRMPRYQDSGRCRGYCFVRFTSKSAVTKALAKDGQNIGKRYVKISLTNNRSNEVTIGGKDTVIPLDCRSIFVKNIPYDADEEGIKNLFMKFGKISNVRIPRWNDTGRLKGLCYIDYINNQSVKQAVAQSGKVEMAGRRLLIDVETGKPKSSFRTADGKLWKDDSKSSVKRGGSSRYAEKRSKQE